MSTARQEIRRLRRSRDGQVIAGVCAGVGRELGVDPVLLRVAFVLLAFFGGSGLVLYLAAWALIPSAPASPTAGPTAGSTASAAAGGATGTSATGTSATGGGSLSTGADRPAGTSWGRVLVAVIAGVVGLAMAPWWLGHWQTLSLTMLALIGFFALLRRRPAAVGGGGESEPSSAGFGAGASAVAGASAGAGAGAGSDTASRSGPTPGTAFSGSPAGASAGSADAAGNGTYAAGSPSPASTSASPNARANATWTPSPDWPRRPEPSGEDAVHTMPIPTGWSETGSRPDDEITRQYAAPPSPSETGPSETGPSETDPAGSRPTGSQPAGEAATSELITGDEATGDEATIEVTTGGQSAAGQVSGPSQSAAGQEAGETAGEQRTPESSSWRSLDPAPDSFWEQPDPLGLRDTWQQPDPLGLHDEEQPGQTAYAGDTSALPANAGTTPPHSGPPPSGPAGMSGQAASGGAGRARGPRRNGRLLLLFTLLGVAAVTGVIGASGEPPLSAYLAGSLGMIGAGVLLGTWVGRSITLIVCGFLTSIALVPATVVDLVQPGPASDHGMVRTSPGSIDEIRPRYELGAGDLMLDLTGAGIGDGDEVRTTVEMGTGDIEIVLPPELDVVVTAEVGAGDLRIFDERRGGWSHDYDGRDLGVDGEGGGTLRLDIESGFGAVEVRRADR